MKAMHEGIEIDFDDMEFQKLDSVDHSTFYECRGEDKDGNLYSGTVEKCCREYDHITDIELIVPSEKRPSLNFDPY